MWVLFRVENEHCTNVGRYRASRDVPLPYEVLKFDGQSDTSIRTRLDSVAPGQQAHTTAVERQTPVAQTLRKVGSTMVNAHAQDYERKRQSVTKESDSEEDENRSSDSEGEEERRSESSREETNSTTEERNRMDTQAAEEALHSAGQ